MASSVENQTANRAAAFWRGVIRKISAPNPAITEPSTSESRIRSVENCAMACNPSAGVIASSLAPFQQLAQPRQFLRINACLFQNVQHQHLVRITEKAVHQMPDLEPPRIFPIDFCGVHVRALVFYVLNVSFGF